MNRTPYQTDNRGLKIIFTVRERSSENSATTHGTRPCRRHSESAARIGADELWFRDGVYLVPLAGGFLLEIKVDGRLHYLPGRPLLQFCQRIYACTRLRTSRDCGRGICGGGGTNSVFPGGFRHLPSMSDRERDPVRATTTADETRAHLRKCRVPLFPQPAAFSAENTRRSRR